MKNKIHAFWNAYQFPFVISTVLGLLLYFPMYTNQLSNPDSVWRWGEFFASNWELSLGRWGLIFVDRLRWGMTSPILSTTISLLFFSAAGVLFVHLFEVKGRAMRSLIPLCIVCTPLIAVTNSYYYCSAAYAFAFFAAILAVEVVVQTRSFYLAVGLGSLCLTLSLSVYQSNLGVAAAVCLMYIVHITLQNPKEPKQTVCLTGKLITMGAIGAGSYNIILILLLKQQNIELSGYKGAGNVGLQYIVEHLIQSVKNCYTDFFVFFFQSSITVNSYGARLWNTALFVLGALLSLYIVFLLRKHLASLLMILGCFFLFPLACNIVNIIVPDTRIILLTSGGMSLFVPFVLFFSEQVRLNGAIFSRGLKLIQMGTYLIALLLIGSYTLINSADALVMRVTQNQTISLANRAYAQLESFHGYNEQSQLLIAGTPAAGNYPIPVHLRYGTNSYANWGMVWQGYNGCWQEILRQFVGVDTNWCSEEQYNSIVNSPEFLEMPIYPHAGSISVIQDVYVIKISNIN